MIISAKNIVASESRRCWTCAKLMGKDQIEVCAAAEEGDAPFTVYIHPECAGPDVLGMLQGGKGE